MPSAAMRSSATPQSIRVHLLRSQTFAELLPPNSTSLILLLPNALKKTVVNSMWTARRYSTVVIRCESVSFDFKAFAVVAQCTTHAHGNLLFIANPCLVKHVLVLRDGRMGQTSAAAPMTQSVSGKLHYQSAHLTNGFGRVKAP